MHKPQFLKQKNMLRVLYSLAPVLLVAIYYFGWRIAAMVCVAVLCCFTTEWIMADRRNGRVSYACFVTAALYALSLPPTTPFWIVAVGAVIAILFAKEAFGGFGKNVFNPAVVGRAFVFVCFPVELTARFIPVIRGIPGGFASWSYTWVPGASDAVTSASITMADAVTAATPMLARRDYGYITNRMQLLLGNISGLFRVDQHIKVLAAGSAGEVCAVVLLLSAVYLVVTKTAQWRLMVSTLVGAFLLNGLLHTVLAIDAVPPLYFTMFSGALLYAAVFMVTDPVSAPKQPVAQWVYGMFIGGMIVFFRFKAVFVGGVGFAILLGNILAPSLDLWLQRIRPRTKKEVAA